MTPRTTIALSLWHPLESMLKVAREQFCHCWVPPLMFLRHRLIFKSNPVKWRSFASCWCFTLGSQYRAAAQLQRLTKQCDSAGYSLFTSDVLDHRLVKFAASLFFIVLRSLVASVYVYFSGWSSCTYIRPWETFQPYCNSYFHVHSHPDYWQHTHMESVTITPCNMLPAHGGCEVNAQCSHVWFDLSLCYSGILNLFWFPFFAFLHLSVVWPGFSSHVEFTCLC